MWVSLVTLIACAALHLYPIGLIQEQRRRKSHHVFSFISLLSFLASPFWVSNARKLCIKMGGSRRRLLVLVCKDVALVVLVISQLSLRDGNQLLGKYT